VFRWLFICLFIYLFIPFFIAQRITGCIILKFKPNAIVETRGFVPKRAHFHILNHFLVSNVDAASYTIGLRIILKLGGGAFPEFQRPGRETDHLAPPIAKEFNAQLCPSSLPCDVIVWCFVKHKANCYLLQLCFCISLAYFLEMTQ